MKIYHAKTVMVYVSETGIKFGVRKAEHKQEAETLQKVHFTRSKKEEAETTVVGECGFWDQKPIKRLLTVITMDYMKVSIVNLKNRQSHKLFSVSSLLQE